MNCPHCLSENTSTAKFCNECGMPLSGKIAEAARESQLSNDDPLRDESKSSLSNIPEITAQVDQSALQQSEAVSPLTPEHIPAITLDELNSKDSNEPSKELTKEASAKIDTTKQESELLEFIPKGAPSSTDPAKTADLTGIDECLVDSTYVPPKNNWRTGATMEIPRVGDNQEDQKKEFRAPEEPNKKGGKGKIIAITLLILVLLGAGVAGATYYLELWGGKTLPNVEGMTQIDATYTLESKEFKVTIRNVISSEPEGLVLSMDPAPGSRIESGSEILINVSQTPIMPEVVGMQRDEATNLLTSTGFTNVNVVTVKSDEREGIVLSVTPEAGEKITVDTAIEVSVAEPYLVPDISGLSLEEAKLLIEEASFVAATQYIYDNSVEAGTILGTDPVAGTKLASGTTVTINLSLNRGAELESLTWDYLSSLTGSNIVLNGTTYALRSVDGVTYKGDDTVAFTITGSGVTTLGDGEVVYGSRKQISGTIVWDSSNNVVNIY